jgi:hypothetical protein
MFPLLQVQGLKPSGQALSSSSYVSTEFSGGVNGTTRSSAVRQNKSFLHSMIQLLFQLFFSPTTFDALLLFGEVRCACSWFTSAALCWVGRGRI